MKIICLSCSNVQNNKDTSASTRACHLLADLLHEQAPNGVDVETLALIDYALQPCIMCGECFESWMCIYDKAFNELFARLTAADGWFVVVPHYAPLPAKLMILLEKLQEFSYLHSFNELKAPFPLSGKRIGLVAHGGMEDSDRVVEYYRKALLTPLSGAFAGVGMKEVVAAESGAHGVAFGIKRLYRRNAHDILPVIEHDWEMVRARLQPLTKEMLLD